MKRSPLLTIVIAAFLTAVASLLLVIVSALLKVTLITRLFLALFLISVFLVVAYSVFLAILSLRCRLRKKGVLRTFIPLLIKFAAFCAATYIGDFVFKRHFPPVWGVLLFALPTALVLSIDFKALLNRKK